MSWTLSPADRPLHVGAWVLHLGPDERLAPDDERALAGLAELEPDPSTAYLLRVFDVIDVGGHHRSAARWSPRLFDAGASVARNRRGWTHECRTTLRIQSAASAAEHSTKLRPWVPRPPSLPLMFGGTRARPQPARAGEPALSAIVISRHDERMIERALGSVVGQECPEVFEVILVTSGAGREAEIAAARFPQVRIVELDRPALPGTARNAGLWAARGTFVSFPGAHVELAPGSLAARLWAHRLGYAMVTGTMLNGTRTAAGWASYLLDNSTVLPGRPSGPLARAPIRCSYLREALVAVGGFPEDMRAGEDTVVNHRLFDLGYGAYRAGDIALYHHSPCRTTSRLVRHHFVRGRGRGRILFDSRNPGALASYLLAGPLIRLRRTWTGVRAWAPELRLRLLTVLPLIVAAVLSAWLGACYELALRALRSGRA